MAAHFHAVEPVEWRAVRSLPLVILLAAACASTPTPSATPEPRLGTIAVGAAEGDLVARARLLGPPAVSARPGRRGIDALADSLASSDTYAVVGPEVVAGALLDGLTPRVEQLVPIARLPSAPLVIAVAANSPISDVNAFRLRLESAAGSLRFAGASVGGIEHQAAAFAVKAAGNGAAALVYAAYGSNAAAIKGVVGGQSDILVARYADVRAAVEAKQLRAIAVASGSRVGGLDLPTLREAKLEVDLADWALLVGPPTLTQARLAALRDLVKRTRATWSETLRLRAWLEDASTDGMTTFIGVELARATALYGELGLRR